MRRRLSLTFLLLLSTAALATTAGKLPFINNDYPQALQQARQRHLPIFVDVWAPW